MCFFTTCTKNRKQTALSRVLVKLKKCYNFNQYNNSRVFLVYMKVEVAIKCNIGFINLIMGK